MTVNTVPGLAHAAGEITRELAGLRSEVARVRQARVIRASGGRSAELRASVAAGLKSILPLLTRGFVDAVVTPDADRYAELLLSERGAAGTCSHCGAEHGHADADLPDDEDSELLLERGAEDIDQAEPQRRSPRGRRAGRKHRAGQNSAAGRPADEGDNARADGVERNAAGPRPRPQDES